MQSNTVPQGVSLWEHLEEERRGIIGGLIGSGLAPKMEPF